MSVYDRDDYYRTGNPNPPPMPPPHQTQTDAYDPPPMNEKNYDPYEERVQMDDRHSFSDEYNHQAMGWDNHPRGSMSDMKLTEQHYDSDDEDFGPLPGERKRRSCLDKICCGCCTCCPRWARYLSCCLLLILIALGIVVGVLAALFKKPSVSFNGLEGEPQVAMDGTNVQMNFTLDISVDNQNVESVTFEKIVATAYYPNYHNQSIGGGELDNVHISSYKVTNISFPFSIEIDAANSESQAIVQDLLDKCGLTGGTAQQITIDYDVTPTLRIIGIPISFTISNNAKIDCPSDLSSLAGGGLASLIPIGASPTST